MKNYILIITILLLLNLIIKKEKVIPKNKIEIKKIIIKEIVEDITFLKLNYYKENIKEKTIYSDIINHSSDPFLTANRITNAHETVHGINNYLRGLHIKEDKKYNAFYLLNSNYFILEEPKVKKSQIIEFIPEKFQKNNYENYINCRYNLYIKGQNEWENEPLYIMDEAIAYLLNAKVGIEDYNNGDKSLINRDIILGCVDFRVFSVALAMTIEKYDKYYFENNKDYKIFMKYYLKETKEIYQNYGSIFKHDFQDKVYKTFEENEKYKNFIKINYE